MDFCKEGSEREAEELGLENLKILHNGHDLADVSVMAGIFSSKTQARKNGYYGPIPCGYSEHGSRKNRIYIWNPEYDDHIWRRDAYLSDSCP